MNSFGAMRDFHSTYGGFFSVKYKNLAPESSNQMVLQD